MQGRQRILQWFLRRGNIADTKLMKLLFLTKMETPIDTLMPFYDFLPYKFGPFSHLVAKDSFWFKKDNINFDSEELPETILRTVEEIERKYRRQSLESILSYVYNTYPYFALRSEVREKYLRHSTRLPKPPHSPTLLNTIHYEDRSVDTFINRLICQRIDVLVDVRKDPVSMKYGFRRKSLERYASMHGFIYVHLPDLGVEREMRAELNTMADYENLFRNYRKTTLVNSSESIEQISSLLHAGKRIALFCFEKNPECCHRSCVAEVLSKGLDMQVMHI